MTETPICPNCGEARSGQFCANCGQRTQPIRQNTWYFLSTAFRDYFGVDGRLWVTLRLLLLRPGRLTEEYLNGRRKRYLAPLRLYLSATLLFFFLLSVLDPVASLEEQMGGALRDSTTLVGDRLAAIEEELNGRAERLAQAEEAVHRASSRLDSLSLSAPDSLSQAEMSDLASRAMEEADQARDALEERQADDAGDRNRLEWQRSVLETYPPDSTIRPIGLSDAAALLFPSDSGGIDLDPVFGESGPRSSAVQRLTDARTGSERRTALADLARSTIERVPVVMFLMLPLFALLMKLVYVRRKWYYSEHLVFALHNHAVAFFGFSAVAVMATAALDPNWVAVANTGVVVGLSIYFFVAQKRVYGQGFVKTLVKYFLILFAYWGVITFFGITLLLLLATLVG